MFRYLLKSEFSRFAVLSDTQLDQLEAHYRLLMRWNERINLTRIRDKEETVRLHYCESLFLAQFLPKGVLRIVDVGSGGGFPGIPVAIFRPECEVTLIESHQRKAVFLREAARDLPNVKVLSQRAEDVQGGWDWSISRAVDPVEVLRLSLAPRTALLISEEDAKSFEGQSKPLPWGQTRVLFHVELYT